MRTWGTRAPQLRRWKNPQLSKTLEQAKPTKPVRVPGPRSKVNIPAFPSQWDEDVRVPPASHYRLQLRDRCQRAQTGCSCPPRASKFSGLPPQLEGRVSAAALLPTHQQGCCERAWDLRTAKWEQPQPPWQVLEGSWTGLLSADLCRTADFSPQRPDCKGNGATF